MCVCIQRRNKRARRFFCREFSRGCSTTASSHANRVNFHLAQTRTATHGLSDTRTYVAVYSDAHLGAARDLAILRWRNKRKTAVRGLQQYIVAVLPRFLVPVPQFAETLDRVGKKIHVRVTFQCQQLPCLFVGSVSGCLPHPFDVEQKTRKKSRRKKIAPSFYPVYNARSSLLSWASIRVMVVLGAVTRNTAC